MKKWKRTRYVETPQQRLQMKKEEEPNKVTNKPSNCRAQAKKATATTLQISQSQKKREMETNKVTRTTIIKQNQRRNRGPGKKREKSHKPRKNYQNNNPYIQINNGPASATQDWQTLELSNK